MAPDPPSVGRGLWLLEFALAPLLVLLVAGLEPVQGQKVYTNTWAVHIPGGQAVADQVASKHGFLNYGHVSSVFLVLDTVKSEVFLSPCAQTKHAAVSTVQITSSAKKCPSFECSRRLARKKMCRTPQFILYFFFFFLSVYPFCWCFLVPVETINIYEATVLRVSTKLSNSVNSCLGRVFIFFRFVCSCFCLPDKSPN